MTVLAVSFAIAAGCRCSLAQSTCARAGLRLERRLPAHAERRLRRRGGRRRQEFARPDLRLHRTGHPYARSATTAPSSQRVPALLFDANGKFVREWGRTSTASTTPSACASTAGQRVDDRRRRQSGREVRSRGRILLVLGRKPEAIDVRRQPRWRRGAGGGGAGGGGPGGAARRRAARAAPGSGVPGSTFSEPSDVAWDAGQHLHRRRRRHHEPHRQVRQGRPLHPPLGIHGHRAGPVQRREGARIDRQGTSTPPTCATSASRSSTQRHVQVAVGNVGTPMALCMTTRGHAVL